jgi:hypothetical protein
MRTDMNINVVPHCTCSSFVEWYPYLCCVTSLAIYTSVWKMLCFKTSVTLSGLFIIFLRTYCTKHFFNVVPECMFCSFVECYPYLCCVTSIAIYTSVWKKLCLKTRVTLSGLFIIFLRTYCTKDFLLNDTKQVPHGFSAKTRCLKGDNN